MPAMQDAKHFVESRNNHSEKQNIYKILEFSNNSISHTNQKFKFALYLWYYAKTCNKWRGSSPLHRNQATQKRCDDDELLATVSNRYVYSLILVKLTLVLRFQTGCPAISGPTICSATFNSFSSDHKF